MAAWLKHNHKSQENESLAGWEWHQDCLVVTTLLASCFDLKSLKKLLKRESLIEGSDLQKPDELLYAMHEACHVSQAIRASVAKELNAKFRSTVQKVGSLSIREIQDKAVQTPWLAPLIWACYASDSLEVRQTGRRMAHSIIWKGMKRLRGSSQAAREKERADNLLKQNAELRKRLKQEQKEAKKLAEQIKRLSAQKAARPTPALPPAAPLKNEVKRLRRELSEKTGLARDLQHELAVWRSLALNAEQDQSRKEQNQNQEPQSPAVAECGHDCVDCICSTSRDCPLNGKTVAVIGGLDRLEQSYCQVIEGMGGQGLCHTGKVRSGARRLRQLVNKSDMVVYLTPVNCHGSLDVVKKQCKRCNTPFCPLNSTSPATLESRLREMATFF